MYGTSAVIYITPGHACYCSLTTSAPFEQQLFVKNLLSVVAQGDHCIHKQ